LPLRFAEWGTVYRFERSGTLHGLTRVRGFTQDDAHLFCRVDQMPAEIDQVLKFSLDMLRDFGFSEFNINLSTRPEKRVGEEERWDASENALREALERSTIQFDFNLPERFDISYIGEDGKQHRPYMLHRALLGSMERFFGVLIEHHGGAFPAWLAPEQVRILPIAERHQEYGDKVLAYLKQNTIRADVDSSSNTLGYRVRQAQADKIPFVFVIGDKEVENSQVSIRKRGGDDLGVHSFEDAAKMVQDIVEKKI
jgi:threonyl-tRNA synthetase